MITQLLRWWGRQLLSLLPDRMRGAARDERRGVLVTLVSPPGSTPAEVDIALPSGPAERLWLDDAGLSRLRAIRARLPRGAVRLRLQPGSLLQRDVTLPLAAERGLDQVLHYEMDRLTPFTAAEAFWGWTVTRRDRPHARLHLRLTLAPRAPIAPLLAALASANTGPTLLEAADGAGRRSIDLSSREGAGPGRTTPVLRAGMVLCGVLVLAVIALPFLRQSIALAGIEARIETLTPAVTEAARLRRDIEAQAVGGSLLTAARQQVGDPLQAIAAVTNALPDDTWLTDLTVQQRRLRIDGESRAAVRLIARLAADPMIEGPSFAAPVTRDDGTHADLFSISADLAP